MIKTSAELADEQAKQAIEDAKGIRPRMAMAGNGPTAPPRSLIQLLSDKAARDRDDYAELIASIRRFMEQRRAELEAFERLMGTK